MLRLPHKEIYFVSDFLVKDQSLKCHSSSQSLTSHNIPLFSMRSELTPNTGPQTHTSDNFTIFAFTDAFDSFRCSVTRMLMANSEDPVRDMEEGKAEGEKGPQVSDDLENDDYLRMKMKKHRRKSQGYAEGSPTSDEESEMTEIDLND